MLKNTFKKEYRDKTVSRVKSIGININDYKINIPVVKKQKHSYSIDLTACERAYERNKKIRLIIR
jgi:hypothetical protein